MHIPITRNERSDGTTHRIDGIVIWIIKVKFVLS